MAEPMPDDRIIDAAMELREAWQQASSLRQRLASFECSGPPEDAASWIRDAAEAERNHNIRCGLPDYPSSPCWKIDRGQWGDPSEGDNYQPHPDNGWCDQCCEREQVREEFRKAMQRRGIAIRRLLMISVPETQAVGAVRRDRQEASHG